MNSIARSLIGGLVLIALSSCSKENYGYIQKQNNRTDQNFPVKEMKGSNAIDLLWVVDNSGSMGSYQQQVIANADIFMNDFIKEDLNWKMGVISTSERDSPYVGFNGTMPLNSTVSDPVLLFGSAIARLGVGGDGDEKSFTPILKALRNDPTFLRSTAPLAVIIVTDAPEQSSISAAQFNAQLATLTQGRNIFAYGVFGAVETGCMTQDDRWEYKNSPYEAFILNALVGKTYPICKDFGTSLADIAHDIVTRVAHTAIYLTSRPDTSTLQVLYHGEALPAGSVESGGIWVYDYRLNAIVFNSLDFAKNDTDSVRVIFEEQR